MTDTVLLRTVEATTHGRVLVRPARGTPRGLLLGFHGYAEDAEAQLRRLVEIPGADGWTLASVQGLNRFYRGRSEEVVASWMTRQDRDVAIADNIRYVDVVVESVVKDAPGPLPLVHAGFSQGVAMAFRAAVRGRFGSAGVIAVGGDVPPELLQDPGSRFPRVLLARGTRDEWYTQAKLHADVAALEARSVDVRSVVIDAGHEWTAEVGRKAGRFLAVR